MSENHFEKGFQCLFGLTQRVSAIERLIQTLLMPNRTYMLLKDLSKPLKILYE
jgi:hypothetical protein